MLGGGLSKCKGQGGGDSVACLRDRQRTETRKHGVEDNGDVG